jgi:hypothetical protein
MLPCMPHHTHSTCSCTDPLTVVNSVCKRKCRCFLHRGQHTSSLCWGNWMGRVRVLYCKRTHHMHATAFTFSVSMDTSACLHVMLPIQLLDAARNTQTPHRLCLTSVCMHRQYYDVINQHLDAESDMSSLTYMQVCRLRLAHFVSCTDACSTSSTCRCPPRVSAHAATCVGRTRVTLSRACTSRTLLQHRCVSSIFVWLTLHEETLGVDH